MRILAAIPHYYRAGAGASGDSRAHGSVGGDSTFRLSALTACVTALHQLFGRPQCVIDIARRTTLPANQLTARSLTIVICTTGDDHLLGQLQLGPGYFEHHATHIEPMLLGFECHAVLRDQLGGHDYYCFLEDDLILHDPWFFVKLAWFAHHVGDERLLQPNRYEVGLNVVVHKAYVDGNLHEETTSRFQDVNDDPSLGAVVMGTRIEFRRTLNPHSGCFFLNARQMEHWSKQSHFLDRDMSFIGPLESAATLGIMRTFKVYKPVPENAAFVEIEHFGTGFLRQVRGA